MTTLSLIDTLIIQTVKNAGGCFHGTNALVELLDCDRRHALRRIKDLCQAKVLVRSYPTTRRGAGKRQVYRLRRNLCNPGEKETLA